MAKRKLPIGARYPIYLKRLRGKGWGVFCASKIPRHADFSVSPLLVLSRLEATLMKDSALETYWYDFGAGRRAIGMGLGSVMNHSSKPNCSFHFSKKKRTLTFFSLKAIPANTELTHDYGWDSEVYGEVGIDEGKDGA